MIDFGVVVEVCGLAELGPVVGIICGTDGRLFIINGRILTDDHANQARDMRARCGLDFREVFISLSK